MSKKYLIDESELGEYYIEANEYKEVEVLDINAVIVESATIGIRLHEYIKENNLLIVKIIE